LVERLSAIVIVTGLIGVDNVVPATVEVELAAGSGVLDDSRGWLLNRTG
jgi:hypothetical protein